MSNAGPAVIDKPKAVSTGFVILNWVFCVAWMAVIYYMSDMPNSFHVTEHYLGVLNFFVRKWAHVSEYAVLTILFYRALRPHVHSTSATATCMLYAAALGGAICYALTDEYHQAHVFGRSSSIGDVAVDSAGALLAIAVLLIRAPSD